MQARRIPPLMAALCRPIAALSVLAAQELAVPRPRPTLPVHPRRQAQAKRLIRLQLTAARQRERVRAVEVGMRAEQAQATRVAREAGDERATRVERGETAPLAIPAAPLAAAE
jgi:hypothetical protein